MLTQEAVDWFQNNRGSIGMTWHTEDDEGEVNGYFSQEL